MCSSDLAADEHRRQEVDGDVQQRNTVNLKNAANQIIATTTTDSSGKYLFSGVFAGTYTVEVDESSPALNGWVPTLSNVGGGTNAATDSNGSPTTVTLTTTSDLTLDFGYVPAPASLAGFVYYDANNNGLKEPGEIGIATTVTDRKSTRLNSSH